MSSPTVVIQNVSFAAGDTGFRVLLCQDADIFGQSSDAVAETIAETRDDVPAAIRDLELELRGWDAVESGDLDWLWSKRPDRISRSARHFAGALLEDVETDEVVNEFSTPDEDIGESAPQTDKSGSEGVKIFSHPQDCGHLDEYRVGGECLRCEQAFNTADERDVSKGVVE